MRKEYAPLRLLIPSTILPVGCIVQVHRHCQRHLTLQPKLDQFTMGVVYGQRVHFLRVSGESNSLKNSTVRGGIPNVLPASGSAWPNLETPIGSGVRTGHHLPPMNRGQQLFV